MANKTKLTKRSVTEFLNAIEDDNRRKDCKDIAKPGKSKIGKSCLYIKSPEDIDLAVLKKPISKSIAYLKKLVRQQSQTGANTKI